MNTKQVDVSLPRDRPDNLIEYIAWLNARLMEIPEEFRASAEVSLSGSDYGLEYDMYYYRPETEAEIKDNIDIQTNWEKQRIDAAKKLLSEYQTKYPELVKL
jgi:hypothetical protein